MNHIVTDRKANAGDATILTAMPKSYLKTITLEEFTICKVKSYTTF